MTEARGATPPVKARTPGLDDAVSLSNLAREFARDGSRMVGVNWQTLVRTTGKESNSWFFLPSDEIRVILVHAKLDWIHFLKLQALHFFKLSFVVENGAILDFPDFEDNKRVHLITHIGRQYRDRTLVIKWNDLLGRKRSSLAIC